MTNSELASSGVATSGTATPNCNMQPPNVIKKTALRDVQNQNGNMIHNHLENSMFAGARPAGDTIKVGGTKRLAPDCPSSAPYHLPMNSNDVNEHIVNARRRFELELGRDRFQNNTIKYTTASQSRPLSQWQREIPQKKSQSRDTNINHVPVVTANSTPLMTSPQGGQSTLSSLPKYSSAMQASLVDSFKHNSAHPHSVDSKGNDDQQRTERFIRLQKFLKQCDESDQKGYINMLLHLSSAELSKHAVDLEKRAIHLTIEEGKEMQRVKVLNILGRSGQSNNPPTTRILQS